ncbi:MAG: hypothetical protein M3N27_00810 [Thermoproteota archaeon]|nr:hypothetical protein [Thermoproteota archaeon]
MKTLIPGILMTSLMFLIPIETNTPAYSQEESNQENDLVFEVQGLRTTPITKNLQLSGEVWEKVCPSNQCKIDFLS